MSYQIPTTQELVDRNIANIESELNQTTPSADRAYNRVIGTVEGMASRGMYKYAADRIKANYALTASGTDLDDIGEKYDVNRTPAVACLSTMTINADEGTIFPINTVFTAENGLKYQTQASVTTGSTGIATLSIKCEDTGESTTLAVGDTLTLETTIDGAENSGTVTSIDTAGADEEEDDDYRVRILDAERADCGGGNSSDYRTWGEAVSNVKRVYPFTGITSGTAVPGERTVYVEATESYDSDGLADATLLAAVKEAILTDPDTGKARSLLGLPDSLLYVESIIRTGIYVEIVGMSITTGTTASAQAAITTAIASLLKEFAPFVQGLDADFDRMDTITGSQLAREVQSVLDAYGGTSQNVLFGTVSGTWLGKYELGNNEKTKLAAITFVDA